MTFPEFLEKYRAEISNVQGILSEPLDDNPARLSEQLRQIERWYGRVSFFLAHANAYLDGAENDAWHRMQGDKRNVAEKECQIADEVKSERKMRDILDGMARAIDRRISLGQSLLRVAEKEARTRVA